MFSSPRRHISPLLTLPTLISLLAGLTLLSLPYLPSFSRSSLTDLNSQSNFLDASETPQAQRDTVDIVISYYDEPLPEVREHVKLFRELNFVKERSERVIIYNKGPSSSEVIREVLGLMDEDEVVPLENVGREGETYLKHILLHYNDTSYAPATPSPTQGASPFRKRTLATHTFYLQPHLAWRKIALPRLALINEQTGFAHFAPLIEGDCGKDLRVNIDFAIWSQLFAMFTGKLCEPGGQTMAWSAQFVVSRRRILANPYSSYAYLDGLLSAPKDHWIHDMWGPNNSGGPSNPAFGHTIERIWPAVFDCWDGRYARQCTDDIADVEKCTCVDS